MEQNYLTVTLCILTPVWSHRPHWQKWTTTWFGPRYLNLGEKWPRTYWGSNRGPFCAILLLLSLSFAAARGPGLAKKSARVRAGPCGSGRVVDFSLNRTARCVVCLSVGSSLDQYYSTSTPNFAVGRESGRRRAAAEPGGAWTRWRRTGDAGSEPVSAATVSPAPDLATRNDTLQSPRVSPLLWFQQCRSLVPGARVASWSCR